MAPAMIFLTLHSFARPMRTIILLTALLIGNFGLCQNADRPELKYADYFQEAYSNYPTIPKGLLEAISYSKTHFQHLNPSNSQSCIGLPQAAGIMALFKDGKGYFKNTLSLVSNKSGIRSDNIISNARASILAYAKAFAAIQQEIGIQSNAIEHNIAVLRYLSELPVNTPGQQYAQDAEIYSILKLLSDSKFMNKIGKKAVKPNLKLIFGANNFKVLSAKKITITGNKIQGGNSSYQAKKGQGACLDYPLATWNEADPSNYSSRGGTPVSAITIHTVQGSYAGCISWFQNPSANVSAHYVLRSSDGQVTQMVCESDKAWHVGTENPYTIGYEHEGYVSDPSWYTTAMYNSSADISRDVINSGYGINSLRTAFWPWTATTNYNTSSIPGSCSRIKGHQHYPNQTHTDPGQYWDWDLYYKLINDPPTTLTDSNCTGSFYDSGGSGGNYGDDERSLFVISPNNASSVTITFNSFDLEVDWDYLYIYDGNSVWAPLIGYYNGTTSPGTITSSGGSLAIEFRSDCATTNAGWDASWTCTTSSNSPNNLQVSVPSCSNSSYTANFTWNNADAGWWLDISTDSTFTTYWNKPIDWLTSTDAPSGFQDPFSLGSLTLDPGITHYWHIWNGSTWTNGTTFNVPSCPDTIPPTTSISNQNSWETTDFTATFSDADLGGSGLDITFYQVLDFDGTEWRAADTNGFFNDNFDVSIHPDWTDSAGTWSINSGNLNQTDEGVNNSNLFARITQNSGEVYLYHWQANMQTGGSANKRQGIHFFSDDASLSNRGNSYFVYYREEGDKCQLYKVVNDTWTIVSDDVLPIAPDTWYDCKVIFNPASGEIKAYMNDVLVSSWTDTLPYSSGNFISLRTGNANTLFNDLKVYRARGNTELITVGAGTNNDVRYQNVNPSTPSCRVKSIVKDNAENWSTLETLIVNIDWTEAVDGTVNDGTGADEDTICSLTELSANWTTASDPNSDVVRYWYAIGSTAGDSDIVGWTDNGLTTSITHSGLTLNNGSTYYFTIKAENGAEIISTGVISDGQTPFVPVISFSADTSSITLPDSTVVFTDATTGAVTWSWTFEGGTPSTSNTQVQTVSYDSAGSYGVGLFVTNGFGCSDSVFSAAYIVVSSPPPAVPIADFSSGNTSGCEPLTVSFTDASANSPTSWLWMFPGGDSTSSAMANPTITYSNPGTYDVTLIATNSWGSDTITFSSYITVYSIPVISVSADTGICEGESVSLTVSGGNTYLWSTGQTDSVITVSPIVTTTYSVTASANGCTSTADSVTVNITTAPIGTITPDQTICIDDSATITASGGDNYLWSTGETTASINVEANTIPTIYSVIISKGTCLDSDTLYSTVTAAQPPIADFISSDTLVYLSQSTITFTNTSSSAISYLWDFGDGNTDTLTHPQNTYVDTGLYTITLIAYSSTCPNDTLVMTNYIQVLTAVPVASFSILGDSICSIDSINFINSSSYSDTYQWIFTNGTPATSTDSDPAVNYDSSGAYFITLMASGPGGADTLVQQINVYIADPPVANFTTNDTIIVLPNTTALFTNTSTNADAYYWDFGDGNTSSDTNPWNDYLNAGYYTVTLVAISNICSNDTMAIDSMIQVQTPVGLNENPTSGEMNIYPNPSTGLVKVIIPELLHSFLNIYNCQGQIVHTQQIVQSETIVDIRNHSEGIYMFRIQTENGEFRQKVHLIK